MAKFELGDLFKDDLKKVSDFSTTTLQEIDINLLDSDERNFYALDGIDELAANIELVGLQQPIRVRVNPDMPGRYFIVSGHRRRAALWKLYEEQPEKWGTVPCIVESDSVSPAMQELRLIYANSDTRKMKDADLAKQAERVQALLYQLKEEGVEFPGRMRDHVAEACKVSAAKLATLKVIREKLVSDLQPRFESGKLPTETAYQLARLPDGLQVQLCKAVPQLITQNVVRINNAIADGADYNTPHTCPDGKRCGHADAFIRHDAHEYNACKGLKCCLDCEQATRSWSPCSNACSKAKKMKQEKAAKEKAKDDAIAAKEQAKRDKVMQADAKRIMKAVDAAGIDDDEVIALSYTSYKISSIRAVANGEPSGRRGYQSEGTYKFYYAQEARAAAKLLHCSADYLLGLTDELQLTAAAALEWKTGNPKEDGLYIVKYDDGGKKPKLQPMKWATMQWHFPSSGGVLVGGVLGWYKIPEV